MFEYFNSLKIFQLHAIKKLHQNYLTFFKPLFSGIIINYLKHIH